MAICAGPDATPLGAHYQIEYCVVHRLIAMVQTLCSGSSNSHRHFTYKNHVQTVGHKHQGPESSFAFSSCVTISVNAIHKLKSRPTWKNHTGICDSLRTWPQSGGCLHCDVLHFVELSHKRRDHTHTASISKKLSRFVINLFFQWKNEVHFSSDFQASTPTRTNLPPLTQGEILTDSHFQGCYKNLSKSEMICNECQGWELNLQK